MKQLIIGIFIIATGVAFAQETSILPTTLAERFSDDMETVTARSMGVAGAFGAVGADFSNATHNPAGVAFFRKKELGLNLGYNNQQTESSYLDQTREGNESVLRLNNLAFVYSNLQTEWINDSLVVKREGLVSWAITLGMNQKNEIHDEISYRGFNPNSSRMNSYIETASQFALNDLSELDAFERQALNTGIMDVNNIGGFNQFSSIIQNGDLQQAGRIARTGARRDYYLAGGANISNKLYLGATLAIPTINFEERAIYEENDTENNYSNFSNLAIEDIREYSSFGGYVNLGAIYRFNDYFRAGLNFKTPSIIEVEEQTTISTRANVNNQNRQNSDSFENTFVMTLPWEAGFQLVGSHPKYGLISLEADYVDISNTRINYQEDFFDFDEDADEDAYKDEVRDLYQGTFNLRGGLEFRLLQNLRLRGGYSYQTSPLENSADEFGADYTRQILGLGAGYRFTKSNITVDLGYNRISNGEFNSSYVLNSQPLSVITDRTSNQIRLGVSKRFNQ